MRDAAEPPGPHDEYCRASECGVPLAGRFTFHFRDAAGLL